MRAPKYSSAAATGVKLKDSAKKRRCTATAMATNRYANMFTSMRRLLVDSNARRASVKERFNCEATFLRKTKILWPPGLALQAFHRRRRPGVHALLQHAKVGTEQDVTSQSRPARELRIGVTQVYEIHKISARPAFKLLRLTERKHRPVKVHASEVGRLGRESHVSFFRLVEKSRMRFLDLGSERICGNGLEEVGSLNHAVPVKRIDHVRIRSDALRRRSAIQERVHGAERAAMLVVAHTPDQHQANEREDGAGATAGDRAAHANLLVDETKQRGQREPGDQHNPDNRVNDVNDVPGIPAEVEWLEQANAVRGGVVQKKMAHRRQHRYEV